MTDGKMTLSIDEAQTLVDLWAKRMGLNHWTIAVRLPQDRMDHDDAIFEVHRHENANRAIIYIAPWLVNGEFESELEEINAEFLDAAIIHELGHILFRDVVFVIKDDIEELMGQVAHELLMRTLSRTEERLVDQLAKALAREWPR